MSHTQSNEYGHFGAFMELLGTLSDSSCSPFEFNADMAHAAALHNRWQECIIFMTLLVF